MEQIFFYADIFITAFCYLGYLWAADKFCKKILGVSRKREWMFAAFSFCGWLLLHIAGIWHPAPHIFSALSYHFLFLGLVLLLFQSDWEKKLLAASMLLFVMELMLSISGSILSCFFLFFQYAVKGTAAPVLSVWENALSGCIGFCPAILAVYWMAEHLMPVFCGKPGRWYVMLAVPLLAAVVLFDVADWGACNGIMVRSGGNMGLYYDQIFSHLEFFVLAALSMTAAGFYVFGMERIYLEQKKSSQYHSQIAYYKMMTEQYGQSERLRHDMKNHIIALSGLCRNGEWEQLEGYLKRMEDSIPEAYGDMTGNKAVDALLYRKRKQAEAEEAEWECDVRIPKESGIDEFDLCVLFGNLLDNALEACEKLRSGGAHGRARRFVRVQAKTVRKCFLLEVENSMDGTERPAGGFTNKKTAQGHGIGLLNVSDVVQKYDGTMQVETGGGIFTISVLIPLPDAAYDIRTTV